MKGKISSVVDDLIIIKAKDIEFEVGDDVEISKVKKRRSLDANAYAWVLMDKLAEKLNIGTTKIYKTYMKDIGGNTDTLCVQNKAVETFCNAWESRGIGWLTNTAESKIEGCTNIIVYYGSSTFDRHQMSRLIEMIVADCEEQGIETKTPDELRNLLNLWGENER